MFVFIDIFLFFYLERKRGSKWKFEVKTFGTPQKIKRRGRDRKKKKNGRTLQIFNELNKASFAEEGLSYFFVLQRKTREVRF